MSSDFTDVALFFVALTAFVVFAVVQYIRDRRRIRRAKKSGISLRCKGCGAHAGIPEGSPWATELREGNPLGPIDLEFQECAEHAAFFTDPAKVDVLAQKLAYQDSEKGDKQPASATAEAVGEFIVGIFGLVWVAVLYVGLPILVLFLLVKLVKWFWYL